MVNLRVFPDAESLSRSCAEKITTILESTLQLNKTAALVLTGGSTPKPVYRLLASSPLREKIRWDRIDFFWGDERCVPPTSPESNYAMAWKSLLSNVPAVDGRIHRMPGELEDPEKTALSYESRVKGILGNPGALRFDLVLLGMGADGHTASLFPGTSWDEKRLVVANYVPKLKTTRITMTPRLLSAARSIVFLTSGAGKAAALASALEDPESDSPTKRIQPEAGSVTWMVDKAAASKLSQPYTLERLN